MCATFILMNLFKDGTVLFMLVFLFFELSHTFNKKIVVIKTSNIFTVFILMFG